MVYQRLLHSEVEFLLFFLRLLQVHQTHSLAAVRADEEILVLVYAGYFLAFQERCSFVLLEAQEFHMSFCRVDEQIGTESLEAMVKLEVVILDFLNRHEPLRPSEAVFLSDLLHRILWFGLKHSKYIPREVIHPSSGVVPVNVSLHGSPVQALDIGPCCEFYDLIVCTISLHKFYIFIPLQKTNFQEK